MMTWQSLNSSRNRVLHHASGSVRLAEWDLGTILKSAEFLDNTNVGIVLQDPQGEMMAITLKTPEDIEGMRVAGKLAAEVLAMLKDHVNKK